MKKIVIHIIFASSMLFAGSFGELGLGYSKGNNSNDYITGFGSLNVIGNIGLRLEYTKNFSENPQFSKEDISRYGVFATYTLPIFPSLSLTPKIGLTKTDGSFKIVDTLESITDNSTTFTYGLEANVDLNNQMSAFIGYTDYNNKFKNLKDIDISKLDTANYTFGLKIHF